MCFPRNVYGVRSSFAVSTLNTPRSWNFAWYSHYGKVLHAFIQFATHCFNKPTWKNPKSILQMSRTFAILAFFAVACILAANAQGMSMFILISILTPLRWLHSTLSYCYQSSVVPSAIWKPILRWVVSQMGLGRFNLYQCGFPAKMSSFPSYTVQELWSIDSKSRPMLLWSSTDLLPLRGRRQFW